MNEWLQNGRAIANRADADPHTRAKILAHVQKITIDEFNTLPHTPELLTQTHQAIWQARGELVGAAYEVTPCPFTREEIADLEQRGMRLGYLPAAVATQEDRRVLGEMFPQMQSQSVKEGNLVTNDESPSGWFDYEASIDAPYLDTTEKQLRQRLAADGRKLLSENQYIVAAQDSKLFTGKYLDEYKLDEFWTWVRLGSRNDGRVVGAYFNSDGHLVVHWSLHAGHHYPNLGGRSSGVNRA